MIVLDWTLLVPGLLAGAAAAGLFLAGLAAGIRLALRRARPSPVLFLSAALRIAAVLGLGWWIAGLGAQALAGFALGFVLMRTLVLAVMRPAGARRAPSCN